MKQFIIIMATVLLAIYIGGTLINGSSDSLKSGSDTIMTTVNTELTEIKAVD